MKVLKISKLQGFVWKTMPALLTTILIEMLLSLIFGHMEPLVYKDAAHKWV